MLYGLIWVIAVFLIISICKIWAPPSPNIAKLGAPLQKLPPPSNAFKMEYKDLRNTKKILSYIILAMLPNQ